MNALTGEVPWLLEDDAGVVHDVLVRGRVVDFARVDGFECIDAHTGVAIEMRDDDRERAEKDLRDAALEIWGAR